MTLAEKGVLLSDNVVVVTATGCGSGGETYEDGAEADEMDGFTCICNAAEAKFECEQN